MTSEDLFTAGNDGLIPRGDAARQAVDSLRGYAYQVTAAALAWLDVQGKERIFLEVAEDYAVVAKDAINAVQVKDTRGSGNITLGTASVRDAILSFVTLTADNPEAEVQLRYLTTSELGTERASDERPGGLSGLAYWRSAAKVGDVGPLRTILEGEKFPETVREFVRSRSDDDLRRDLLRRIHWDCGRPDLNSLRKEFQDRLIVVGRDTFGLPAQEAVGISNLLLYHVLDKSIAKAPADRSLSRADLISLVDNASRISVPVATLDLLALVSSGLVAQASVDSSDNLPIALGHPTWLIEGAALPAPARLMQRMEIQEGIGERLRRSGACFVVGASGIGKSSLAHAVLERANARYFIVDFRDSSAAESRGRLDALVSRLGGLGAQAVVLEDLNRINDPAVGTVLGRTFEALGRRDIAVIVTSYIAPTPKVLNGLGLDPSCTIDCPYFDESESSNLVELYEGDPKIWGKLAHASGAFGHPQLVHAFIAGMAARSWPRSEISTIVAAGLSSGDIAAERDAARRALILVLPETARNLLYRLSLTIGNFNRAMALGIADTPPPVSQAGEALDMLIGPWVETLGRDSYRISPLAAQSGREMIPSALQTDIHHVIASQFMSGDSVNASDVDIVILHAILGKNERALASLAAKILTSGDQLVGFLADNLAAIKLFDTDKPIYRDNAFVSSILRLVQFKVFAASSDSSGIEPCARALLKESEQQHAGKAGGYFQLLSLGSVLGTMGIANHLDNWVDLLLKLQRLAKKNKAVGRMMRKMEAQSGTNGDTISVFFAIGSANLTSVARLEHVIDQLSAIEPEQRLHLLRSIGDESPDYSVLINSAWVTEQRKALDASDAAERYRRMAEQTSRWGVRPITLQCWIARAIMLDEYANDREGALAVIDAAETENGDDVLLARARAKIYWRAQDHERALSILREIADVVGEDNPIERAFALREAAISAAKCDDWAQAEQWFIEAGKSAARAELPDMTVMSIGLGMDGAVAAFHRGDVERALGGLADALTMIETVDPASSLKATYCHHLVRHTVLWMMSRIEGREVIIAGEPITMEPGSCSNTDPRKAIAERPLGPLDLALYMLAEAEVASRTEVGIADRLHERIVAGTIPPMEFSIRSMRLRRDIEDINPEGFSKHLWSFVEVAAFIPKYSQQTNGDFDAVNPLRRDIPSLSAEEFGSEVTGLTDDAVLAYVISCACRQSAESITDMRATLDENFGHGVVSNAVLSRVDAGEHLAQASSFEDVLIEAAMAFRRGVHVTPRNHCLAGIRFLQQAQRSIFKACLIPIVAAWQRGAWTRIKHSSCISRNAPRRRSGPHCPLRRMMSDSCSR